MDQRISMKKFFNYCFNSSHFRTKSKDKELSACTEYSSVSKINDSELKTGVAKNSRFHKLTSKKGANFTNFSSQDDKPQSDTKPLETKTFFSCFKRNSSENETSSTLKKLPALPGAKQVLDTYVQSPFKGENSIEIKTISSLNAFQSQEIETEALMQDSVIELMSKDGTLKLYSATTLTPLSSIQDEERIQTHLSVSFFRPDKQLQYHSSDGPDEVFEENDETSNRLVSNFQNLKMEHSNSNSENRSSGVTQNKKSLVTRDKKNRYLDKDWMSSDESVSLFSDEVKEKIQTYSMKESKDKEKLVPVLANCPCLENQNFISSNSDCKRNISNHPPQPLTSVETYQTVSNVPVASPMPQIQDHCAKSVHSCTSITNHIPPVKKWILQVYFNSMVTADGNISNYPEEIQSDDTSPPFPYAQPKNIRTFNEERKKSMEAYARNSSKMNLNTVSYKHQSNIPPVQSRKNSLTIESENKHFERNRLKTERRKCKSQSQSNSKMSDSDYHIQKENKLHFSRIKSASTTKSRMRDHFRERHQNSKPAIFSQVATYTYYPFIDGPLANKSEWK